jgi:hypothetical protein
MTHKAHYALLCFGPVGRNFSDNLLRNSYDKTNLRVKQLGP